MENFNWSQFKDDYVGGTKLQRNYDVTDQTIQNRCYSHEIYAQQLWDIYNDNKIIKKDLTIGDILPVVDIANIGNERMTLEFLGGTTYEVNLKHEKKFIQMFGYEDIDIFCDTIKDKGAREVFLGNGIDACVLETKPHLKISLWQGYIKKIKEEFIEQIKNPTKAYTAKIVQVNKGGYFVEVQGLEAFMPGSLAAANKLADFKTLMGKEVIVMIEDFLPEMNSFIVSHKKYIEYVLPSKLKQLDLNSKFSGIITGCSKYGIFVEFRSDAEESSIKFTGLLHISKMTDETKAKFESYGYAAGDSIEFYIGEITKDNRIILDEENPVSKLAKLECFVEENSGKLLEATIGSILNFGIIVNIDSISGLIPARQFAMHRVLMKNFIIGDTISVYIDEIRENKLVLKLQEVRS